MLKKLQVKNFAIIDDITVKFGAGLNVLTGETGAGKTLIIEAINMLTGERADSELIRAGQEKLTVQGYFDLTGSSKSVKFLIDENLAEDNDDFSDIIIAREVSRQGKNRSFINGIYTQVNTLKNFGKCFLDLHGQHDHQYLLDQGTHLEIIDSFGEDIILSFKENYHIAYKNFMDSALKLIKLKKQQSEKEIRLDELKIRLNEIEELRLKDNEESELENEKNVLKNHEKIFKLCTALLNSLNGQETNEDSLIDSFSQLLKNVSELSQMDKKFEKYLAEAESVYPLLLELAAYLKDYTDNFDYSAEKIDFIQERLYKISEIKRKYGMDIPKINEYLQVLKKEIQQYDNLDQDIEQAQQDYRLKKEILSEYAIKLYQARKTVIQSIEKEITSELRELDFKSSEFKVSHQFNSNNAGGALLEIEGIKVKPLPDGIDTVEFLISLNSGESVKALRKIASGGEISRIMLALKSIISGVDNITTMIFDEIDTGIGGIAAIITGKKLYSISTKCQVICITHLPQIAAFAEHNYFIEKITQDSRTKIKINKLKQDKKIKEISRMLSGMADSEISMQHAAELINEINSMKNIIATDNRESF
ncbi:MAG: DNA repair protein RecN [Actinobacteria bacterium]|nr:DNA repair protein RecN [Actinomycetota bacterium]